MVNASIAQVCPNLMDLPIAGDVGASQLITLTFLLENAIVTMFLDTIVLQMGAASTVTILTITSSRLLGNVYANLGSAGLELLVSVMRLSVVSIPPRDALSV